MRVPDARKNTGAVILSMRSLGLYRFDTVPNGGMGMNVEGWGRG